MEEPEEARGGGGQDALPPGGVAGAAAAAKAREAAAAINKRWKQSKQPAEIDEKSRAATPSQSSVGIRVKFVDWNSF